MCFATNNFYKLFILICYSRTTSTKWQMEITARAIRERLKYKNKLGDENETIK